ncbi:transposable element Tcb1 transposase [Trichonephila clavipes]|nr:transposable element Tcb1 transposase [Trichonephila clavipes]
MWSMVAQRLTQSTPPAATPDQLWQRVEAAWSAVPQEHIQSLFESMPRRVAASRGRVLMIKNTYRVKGPMHVKSVVTENSPCAWCGSLEKGVVLVTSPLYKIMRSANCFAIGETLVNTPHKRLGRNLGT